MLMSEIKKTNKMTIKRKDEKLNKHQKVKLNGTRNGNNNNVKEMKRTHHIKYMELKLKGFNTKYIKVKLCMMKNSK